MNGWWLHNSGQITENRISAHDVPVVVIDPGDRDHAEVLRDLYEKNLRAYGHQGLPSDLDPLMDALREYADPTPPSRWSNGDVIQAVTTNLVWSRTDGVWYPSAGGNSRVTATDAEFDAWLTNGSKLRVLREQKAGVNP